MNNVPEHLTITFACTPDKVSKSDVEINFQFDNQEKISLYFSKECDFIPTDEHYFNVIYTVYWILLILIGFLIVSIIYYYIKTNNYTFYELIINGFVRLSDLFQKIKVNFIY